MLQKVASKDPKAYPCFGVIRIPSLMLCFPLPGIVPLIQQMQERREIEEPYIRVWKEALREG
jgi:hypothetical protein